MLLKENFINVFIKLYYLKNLVKQNIYSIFIFLCLMIVVIGFFFVYGWCYLVDIFSLDVLCCVYVYLFVVSMSINLLYLFIKI